MNWHDYFMQIADAVALRSKDPTTKVGAVLVNADNHIIGTGYNGMPPGVSETDLWQPREKKYLYVIHAEINCIVHAVRETKGATLYCTLSPCAECMKATASAGVKKVYYRNERFNPDTVKIAELTGIGMEQVNGPK